MCPAPATCDNVVIPAAPLPEPDTDPATVRAQATAIDDRLRHIALVSYLIALAVVLLVAGTPLGDTYDRALVNLVAAGALVALAAAWAFPWHRFPRDRFVVVTIGAVAAVTLLLPGSGGRNSLFVNYYFIIVVHAALYFRRGLALRVALVTTFAGCSLILVRLLPFDGFVPILRTLLIDGTTYVAIALLAGAMLAEITRLASESRSRLHGHRIAQRALAASEEQLAHRAFHDALTNLPNRTLLMERLTQALLRDRRSGATTAVLILDLDRFKVINDSLGHGAGDELLVAVARRLGVGARPGDTVARLGGDEFAFLLEDVKDEAEACAVARECIARLAMPVPLAGREVVIAASIGVAIATAGRGQPAGLLRDADVAMYRAKAEGKARVVVFDAAMNARAMDRLELEMGLRRALDRGELRIHYQPEIDLVSGRVASVEALVRWVHPEHGIIAPGAFIPLAEETGLIVPLGAWALRTSCQYARSWAMDIPDPPPLSVNLSIRQFQEPGLVELVATSLRETGLRPAALVLEITESVLMADAEATIATLGQLKALGVRLAIDDFGTGYSSLQYLQRFPVDYLKIDRAFVHDCDRHPGNSAIVRTVIALAQALDLTVIAEGIETADEACPGYFGHPRGSRRSRVVRAGRCKR